MKAVFSTGLLFLAGVGGFARAKEVEVSLDSLVAAPGNWKMGVKDFEKDFTKEGYNVFVWLTKDKTRAKMSRRLYSNVEMDLKVFEGRVPVQEAIVDFAGGNLNLISLSLFNRGDGGEIGAGEFKERFTAAGKAMREILEVAPRRREADAKSGLLTAGYGWYSPVKGTALLEHNELALEGGEQEFLRLRFARPRAKGPLAASMSHSRGGAAARLGDLPQNVEKTDDGDVFISGLPMVDQGDKGYCVGAATQRVFEYYGIGADMHQIAQIAESDPKKGTDILTMAKELDQIDYRFKTRLDIIGMGDPLTTVKIKKGEYYVGDRVDERKFLKEIRSHVDEGLPLLWGLELGRFPEKPQLSPQTQGGHMRIIIGYNDKKEEVIFSDSWGAGHESKRMRASDAFKATRGLFVLKPTVR